MGNPTTELQQLTNKSIIELYSVELKPDVHFQKTAQTGTYSQSGTTVTISITSHGVAIGDILTIDYTSGSATDGTFAVASSADANSFTVTAANSDADGETGTVSITLSGAGQYVCDSWTKLIPYNNRAIIKTTFREVFEP